MVVVRSTIENSTKLIYQVYTGPRNDLYDVCTHSVQKYAKKIRADHIIQKQPKLFIKPNPFTSNRSREATEKYGGFLPIFEKENAFDYFDRYDQIAIIDADVYIKTRAENIFEAIDPSADFAGVAERDMPLTAEYLSKIVNYSRMQYSQHKKLFGVDMRFNERGAEFFNMGVMVMNKSIWQYINQPAKQFLSRPEFQPFVDGQGAWKWSTDQTLLNTWIRKEKMNIQRLDWKWNGLYTANTKIKEADFVHFFLRDKLPQKGENIIELLRGI